MSTKTMWYVTSVMNGVTYILQDIDEEGWIEWTPFNCYASPWIFDSFAEAFSCCDPAYHDMVWSVPAGGIQVPQ